LQDTVVLSTTEAVYMGAVEQSKEALWLRELIGTFRIIQDSIQIYYKSKVRYILLKIISITSE